MPIHKPQRAVTIRKYRAIKNRHRELYHGQRLRSDDVIKQLMEEFFIAEENTIYRILATDLEGSREQE